MNTQTTIHLSSPVDLITSMPYMLGFHPKRSVVLVNLRGGRLGLTQRIDIPPAEHVLDAMHAMVDPMLKDHPTSVVLLGYEDIEDEAAPLLEALKTAVGWHDDIELTDVLVVRDGRWYSRECTSAACCPPTPSTRWPCCWSAWSILPSGPRHDRPRRETTRQDLTTHVCSAVLPRSATDMKGPTHE